MWWILLSERFTTWAGAYVASLAAVLILHPEPAAPGSVAPGPAPQAVVAEVVLPDAPAPAEYAVHDDAIVGPPPSIVDCEVQLRAAKVRFDPSRLPVHDTKSGMTCGAPQVVRYRSGPGKIRWRGRPRVTCQVAFGLARFEQIVQEEAMRAFGRRVHKILHMGTYNCREISAYPGWVSEHSYANAIDIKTFVLKGGREVTVLGNYGDPARPARNAGGRFLRAVARRAYAEDAFSVVLTPAFDRAHRNHFHLDVARYRVDGTGLNAKTGVP